MATHDPETLLDLVAAVARAAVRDGHVAAAENVSMPVFNRVKVDVDSARGITDPRRNAERTPSADAIQMRFKQLAAAPVKWQELVRVSLLPFDKRTMWLVALRREDRRLDLNDQVVWLALRRVAGELTIPTLSRDQYARTREKLVADDIARYGDDELMSKLLPTVGQVIYHCKTWSAALTLAGLSPPTVSEAPPPPPQHAGLPLPEAMAFYAALNGVWASRRTLRDFATVSGFALADHTGVDWDQLIQQAHQLLAEHDIQPPPPVRAKPLGKGKRLTYQYPVDGVPGAPRPQGAPRDLTDVKARRREVAVLGLRLWLASLGTTDRASQDAYRQWRRGTPLLAPNRFGELGGFTQLKRAALAANAQARQDKGQAVPDSTLAHIDQLRAQLAQPAPTEPVPFSEALTAVLAGPRAMRQAPKQ